MEQIFGASKQHFLIPCPGENVHIPPTSLPDSVHVQIYWQSHAAHLHMHSFLVHAQKTTVMKFPKHCCVCVCMINILLIRRCAKRFCQDPMARKSPSAHLHIHHSKINGGAGARVEPHKRGLKSPFINLKQRRIRGLLIRKETTVKFPFLLNDWCIQVWFFSEIISKTNTLFW